MNVTWRPIVDPSQPRRNLPATAFAFPSERKEPLTDAGHVRSAIARFGQVDGVNDAERAQAFANIKAAAAFFGVSLIARSWHDLL